MGLDEKGEGNKREKLTVVSRASSSRSPPRGRGERRVRKETKERKKEMKTNLNYLSGGGID